MWYTARACRPRTFTPTAETPTTGSSGEHAKQSSDPSGPQTIQAVTAATKLTDKPNQVCLEHQMNIRHHVLPPVTTNDLKN